MRAWPTASTYFSIIWYGFSSGLANGPDRRALLEFDLSAVAARPDVTYFYTLRLFVTYVAAGAQRLVRASYVAQDHTFDEGRVTWDAFGAPATRSVGWFSVCDTDHGAKKEIPLGALDGTVNDGRLILILEIMGEYAEEDKFDFRSKEFGEVFPGVTKGTTPMLIGVPQLVH